MSALGIPQAVLKAGRPTPFYDIIHKYEKVSADQEWIKARILSRGTSENSLTLYQAGELPEAIGDIQKAHVPIVSGKPNSNYAEDGESISFLPIQDGLIVDIELKADETVAVDGYVYGEANTGLAIPHATAPVGAIPVGRAVAGAATGTGVPGRVTVALQKGLAPKT